VFDRGDLVLISFPFSNLSAAKKRPVLMLTRPDAYGDFIALAVTSRPQADHGIALDSVDLVQGRLPLASWIRTDRVVTLNASLVVKEFGRVSESVITAAALRICRTREIVTAPSGRLLGSTARRDGNRPVIASGAKQPRGRLHRAAISGSPRRFAPRRRAKTRCPRPEPRCEASRVEGCSSSGVGCTLWNALRDASPPAPLLRARVW